MRFWNTLFLLACLPSLGLGQVVINEFSCSNYTLGIAGDNEDFVEFYNPSGADVDLGGYFLSDNPANPDKFEIPAGTEVPAGGYLMVMCSAEGELLTNLYVGGFLNTNFKINQCQGESLVFSDPAGNVLESYTYGADIHTTQADHSWSRTTDGAATWSVCLSLRLGNQWIRLTWWTVTHPTRCSTSRLVITMGTVCRIVRACGLRPPLHLGRLFSHGGKRAVRRPHQRGQHDGGSGCGD